MHHQVLHHLHHIMDPHYVSTKQNYKIGTCEAPILVLPISLLMDFNPAITSWLSPDFLENPIHARINNDSPQWNPG